MWILCLWALGLSKQIWSAKWQLQGLPFPVANASTQTKIHKLSDSRWLKTLAIPTIPSHMTNVFLAIFSAERGTWWNPCWVPPSFRFLVSSAQIDGAGVCIHVRAPWELPSGSATCNRVKICVSLHLQNHCFFGDLLLLYQVHYQFVYMIQKTYGCISCVPFHPPYSSSSHPGSS